MTDPRDQIDDWLRTEVNPLGPPPGALDRIRRRARQRKIRQVVVGSAGCAVVLAAAVAGPQLLHGQSAGSRSVAGSQQSVPAHPRTGASASAGTPGPEGSGTPAVPERTRLSITTSGTPPPAHFRPTSVTFVGNGQGGVVGAVIGQAGPPCANPGDCTSLAGTSNYGHSWYGVSAPVAPGPDQKTGVSQLRFANLHDGWAYGPALYETTGGGWPWSPVDTGGQVVTALEASGQIALAVFATCSASTAGYAADCGSFTLYTGTAGSTTWSPVAVPAGYQHMSAGQPSSAALVISAGTGYLLTPSGTVLTGAASGGAWTVAGTAPCKPGPAQPMSGAPQDAQLAVYQGKLLLTCAAQPGGTTGLYTSAGGSSWQLAGTVQGPGTVAGLASAATGQVVLATTAGISYSADEGTTWHSARVIGPVPAGGFSYVGMTSGTLGVAVPADPNAGAVYVTRDGGQTWSKSPITG